MTSRLLLLLTSILIPAQTGLASLYHQQSLDPSQNLPSYTLTDNGVKYQSQFVIVNTQYGSYLRLVLVPLSQPAAQTTATTTTTTTTTSTTTTTTPRPRPAPISPDIFFTIANSLPMNLYSSYICGVYSRPSRNNVYGHFQGKRQLVADLVPDRLNALSDWLSTNTQNYSEPNIVLSLRQQLLEGFSRDKLDELKTIFDRDLNVLDMEILFHEVYRNKTEMVNRAISGIQMFYINDPSSSAFELADVDRKHLLVDLIQIANGQAQCPDCDVDFQDEQEITNALTVRLLPPKMSQQQVRKALEAVTFLSKAKLTANDTSAIFEQFVASVTNEGQPTEDRVQVELTTPAVVKLLVDSEALNAIEEDDEDPSVSEDSDDEDDDVEDEDEDEDDEKPAPRPRVWGIMRQGRRKRSFFNQPRFDRQIVCFLLNNYMRSSSYCGVRTSASQIYQILQCAAKCSPLEAATTASSTRPPTTTTTAPTTTTRSTTTTTRPTPPTTRTTTTTTSRPTTTTTTRRPTSTTTRRPTTTTRTTTTTSRPTTTTPTTTTTSTTTPTTTTTSTTTPTTTTTTPTTTTTSPETTTFPTEASTETSVQCGISNIATRSAAVASSTLFLSPRIVGGRITGTCTSYPWMVKLAIDNGQVCGGSILDDRHVLTAAHCVTNKRKIRATVGEYDTSLLEGTEQVFSVNPTTGVAIHPQFSFASKKNDVAVLTLDEPIDFTQICATPICLNPDYRITSGQSCTIAGWGATSENARVASSTLQEVSVSTYNGTECSSVFPNAEASYFTDPTKQLCAGQPNVGGVDACSGDSGGPLVCLDQETSTWVQAGIVSYGEGCARANYPGVYASTATHYDWITQQLQN